MRLRNIDVFLLGTLGTIICSKQKRPEYLINKLFPGELKEVRYHGDGAEMGKNMPIFADIKPEILLPDNVAAQSRTKFNASVPKVKFPNGKEYEFLKFMSLSGFKDVDSDITVAELKEVSSGKICVFQTLKNERYVLVERLGSGGQNIVYLALDAGEGEKVFVGNPNPNLVAIKTSHNGAIVNDAKALAKLDHPNIVKLLDCIPDADSARYVVLEYIDGQNLSTMVIHSHPNNQQLAAILKDLLNAIAYLDKKKIAHNDFHTRNLMVTKEGVIKVIDFDSTFKCQKVTGNLSSFYLVLKSLCGLYTWDVTNLSGEFYERLVFGVTRNKDLANLMLTISAKNSHEKFKINPEKLLKHPFFENILHSPNDIIEYMKKYKDQGFRPLFSLLDVYSPCGVSSKYQFKEVGSNLESSEFIKKVVSGNFVSYRISERQKIEIILVDDNIRYVALGLSKVFVLSVEEKSQKLTVNTPSRESTISTGDFVWLVMPYASGNRFSSYNGKQWANMLQDCVSDLQKCIRLIEQIAALNRGSYFVLYRIVASKFSELNDSF